MMDKTIEKLSSCAALQELHRDMRIYALTIRAVNSADTGPKHYMIALMRRRILSHREDWRLSLVVAHGMDPEPLRESMQVLATMYGLEIMS